MKKIIGLSMVTILCMTLVGCKDNTNVKMKYNKPVKVEKYHKNIEKI